jgi:hypothetical protein
MQTAARQGKRQSLLFSAPNPALDYDEALKRFAAMQAVDGPAVNPVCRSTLPIWGQRAPAFRHGDEWPSLLALPRTCVPCWTCSHGR